jgi:hypothetical protein
MTLAELPQHLRMLEETGATEIGGRPVQPGYLIANDRFETLTHVSKDKLASMTATMLEDYTTQGKDVKGISRVTGYFSYTNSWNKGKQAELRDRYRTKL